MSQDLQTSCLKIWTSRSCLGWWGQCLGLGRWVSWSCPCLEIWTSHSCHVYL